MVFLDRYNTRLATPTFSVTPGEYASTQTVSISAPAGSTIYYTTNGLLPTSHSTQYTRAITVAANETIQAVAIQAGYTDSLVAVGAYQIGTANLVNFPSGFAANDGVILVGHAALSGSAIQLTDTTAVPSWSSGEVVIWRGWGRVVRYPGQRSVVHDGLHD
jgi:hypothetical protein